VLLCLLSVHDAFDTGLRLFRGKERRGRVAREIAFRYCEPEYCPQVPSEMRHDALGERCGLHCKKRLQPL
jgi:hypothetical protein